MNPVGQVAALLAALIHVYIFVLEAVLFPRPAGHRTFGVPSSDVPAVRPWALNQGFYNLFLAVITAVGLILLHTGDTAQAGRALVAAACGSMIAAALVLLATNRRMLRAAAVQGLAPLIAIILLIVA